MFQHVDMIILLTVCVSTCRHDDHIVNSVSTCRHDHIVVNCVSTCRHACVECFLKSCQLAGGHCVWLTTARVLLKDSHCLAFCLKVLRALMVRSQCFDATEVRKGRGLWRLWYMQVGLKARCGGRS